MFSVVGAFLFLTSPGLAQIAPRDSGKHPVQLPGLGVPFTAFCQLRQQTALQLSTSLAKLNSLAL